MKTISEEIPMLTNADLVTLYRSLRDERVLSVYIDGSAADPAVQRTWRLQLERGLKDIRTWIVDAPRAEREAFERCAETLESELATFEPTIRSPGWVAFITAKGVYDAHPIPVPTETLAVWSNGPCVAPYVRALKEATPVVVAVVDARRTMIHRYRFGGLDRVDTIRAHHVMERSSHMGAVPRQGFHMGTHGSAGRDAEQRALLEGRDRMLAEAAERIASLAGADGWIVLGGIKRVSARLAALLKEAAPDRVLDTRSLDVHATDAEIAAAARSGASSLRSSFDTRRIDEIIERAGAHGLGVVGANGTKAALDERRVRDLYLTRLCFENDAVDTEEAVRVALDQNANIEVVSDVVAEKLDPLGGIAAGLRFRSVSEMRESESAETLVGV